MLGLFLSTSPTEYSDMASVVAGAATSDSRWQTYLVDAPAGSIHEAELVFVDPITTGSTKGVSMKTSDGRTIAFRHKNGHTDAGPDEDRVTRDQKRGRVTSTVPVAPPRNFSAGSILERRSMVTTPADLDGLQMAFVEPDIRGREVAIATAFHSRTEPKAAGKVPVMLASLVNNDKPDVLATAYAPEGPDYASTSPFESILRTEEESGRFFPPVPKNDHAWAGNALPPHVFTDREQQCLASGVYFEARGEPVKGQAAVAQVILNRVRNPAYPDTICGVVYQNKRWRNRCQFSFACDGIRDRVRSRHHWSIAKDVSMAVTAGKIWLDEVGSSTHYHATYVRPKWARRMKRVGRIGLHIFYRTHGGGWS
ncbi:cell wall hydrolase [Hoeflea sp. E7-10]|uniref:Cell wall hydrolase n=1 Tax=Hoeflea poritis TaxID=2993659 RepID=A0ABT4VJK5_9HYPH|nr:cell wall hydrolase [Hoeflea poritis]MDA4844887.1 cell wall hydrolase [Hoeflea poritis]